MPLIDAENKDKIKNVAEKTLQGAKEVAADIKRTTGNAFEKSKDAYRNVKAESGNTKPSFGYIVKAVFAGVNEFFANFKPKHKKTVAVLALVAFCIIALFCCNGESGALGKMNMSDSRFKASCTYLGSRYDKDNEIVIERGKQYFKDNSDDNLPQLYINSWNDYLENGKRSEHYRNDTEYYFNKCKTLEEFLDLIVYGPKGASLYGDETKALLKQMQEYPDEFVGEAFLLKSFSADYVMEDLYYSESFGGFGIGITVYDYRKNTTSPTIFEREDYDMYVVFLGNCISDTGDVELEFALKTVEKCE